MRRRRVVHRLPPAVVAAVLAILAVAAGACGGSDRGDRPGRAEAGEIGPDPTAEEALEPSRSVVPSLEFTATEEDWRILRETARWAWEMGLDTLPIGSSVARIAERFVGAPYTPYTLEVAGPERVVVNLREFDCVTLVESVLALSHFIRRMEPAQLDDPEAYQGAYVRLLEWIRYRGGTLDGYASRLHYFSEWLADAGAKGLADPIVAELDGVEDPEPIDFMSTHPGAYRQLSDPEVLAVVRRTEEELSRAPRLYVPEEEIAGIAARIQDGDVIAATSTVEGLDIAHTGFALWRGGRLHLLHAPLVGSEVQISETPLADRIVGISSQDGIMVARPLEPSAR